MDPMAIKGMIDILWLMVVVALTAGLLTIFSSLVTGFLVFRTKRDNGDRLFPAKEKARVHKPIVVDDLAREEAIPVAKEEEGGLPPAIRKINERFSTMMATNALKERKRDAV